MPSAGAGAVVGETLDDDPGAEAIVRMVEFVSAAAPVGLTRGQISVTLGHGRRGGRTFAGRTDAEALLRALRSRKLYEWPTPARDKDGSWRTHRRCHTVSPRHPAPNGLTGGQLRARRDELDVSLSMLGRARGLRHEAVHKWESRSERPLPLAWQLPRHRGALDEFAARPKVDPIEYAKHRLIPVVEQRPGLTRAQVALAAGYGKANLQNVTQRVVVFGDQRPHTRSFPP